MRTPSETAPVSQCGDMPRRADVVVVGGGLAGSALAAALARRGHDVAIFERDRFPRDKLCGEFLSFESGRALESIGCRERVLSLAPPVLREAVFTAPSGRELRLALPEGCLGVSRRALDELLWRHAGECGARTFQGAAVRSIAGADDPTEARVEVRGSGPEGAGAAGVWSAPLVVGAHGRRDGLDRALERGFVSRPAPWVGLQRHYRPTSGAAGEAASRELVGRVEIHAFEGGYCGLSLVETGEVNACMLLRERFLAAVGPTGGRAADVAVSRASRPLARRLDALEPAEEGRRAVARVPFGRKDRGHARLLHVGDAAGVITPLCGDGQAMALSSARLLAERLDALLARGDATRVECATRLAREWDRAWRREFRWRVALGRMLQGALLRRRLAELLVIAGRLLPGAAPYLVRATRGC